MKVRNLLFAASVLVGGIVGVGTGVAQLILGAVFVLLCVGGGTVATVLMLRS